MAGLFDKLNVLVKSNLRTILGGGSDRSSQLAGPKTLDKGLEQEIATLRQRINQALDGEDGLKAQIATLQHEVTEWDAKADAALAAGDDAEARYAVQQMQLKQQQTALVEADLEQHRYSAGELIRQVNELEAVVAEARQQEAAAPDTQTSDAPAENPLAARVRRARELLNRAAPTEDEPAHTVTSPMVDDEAVDDDLAQRRARLSQ